MNESGKKNEKLNLDRRDFMKASAVAATAAAAGLAVSDSARAKADSVQAWAVYRVDDSVYTPGPCPFSAAPRFCVACPPGGSLPDKIHVTLYDKYGAEICEAYATRVRDCGDCGLGPRLRFRIF